MSGAIRLHSRVGKDGVLDLRVPLAPADADAEVLIAIERVSPTEDREDWHQFIESTYGSCAALGLVRAEQGEIEEREALE